MHKRFHRTWLAVEKLFLTPPESKKRGGFSTIWLYRPILLSLLHGIPGSPGDAAEFSDSLLIIPTWVADDEAIAYKEGMQGAAHDVKRGTTKKGDVRRTWADTSKAAGDLGFSPRTALRDGLRAEREQLMQRASE